MINHSAIRGLSAQKSYWLLNLPLWLFCFLVSLPILFLVLSWTQVDASLWVHLWQTQMLDLLKNTLILIVGVGFGVTLLGVSLAWLTAICEFPGRKFFDWALILPLAVPAYVLAFVVLGIFDFGGSVQSLLRSAGMNGYLDVRSAFTVVCVMSSVLYPYVYLLARSAFLAQGTELIEIGRTLGLNPSQAFLRVALPAAKPAIIAGTSLALMEALADFGAVSIFGYDTFTTAIYKSWYSLFSIETAAQLASLLLLFVILALSTEMYFRPKTANQEKVRQSPNRLRLNGVRCWLATLFCGTILLLTVVVPALQLVVWSLKHLPYLYSPEFIQIVVRTFLLGAFAAGLVVLIALPFAFSVRRGNGMITSEVAGLGYAIPGSILAVGIMLTLTVGDRFWVFFGERMGLELKPIFIGSLLGLMLAYVIRYFRPGYGALASGMRRVKQSYHESAQLMAIPRRRILGKISLPLLMPALLTGALIVFVDVIKEMPASLLLRPFGWDTLAIKIYELTSEGEWERAGLYALVLVLVSTLPVAFLIRQSRRG